MSTYTGPDCRLCRREGCKLFLKGERCLTKKCAMERSAVVPGQHGTSRKKVTEYGNQLREKQKVKRAYGVNEVSFRKYYDESANSKFVTGEHMLSLLERRLDNVVYRMGIGASRAESRQIVSHGQINVNGKNVNIPSYRVALNDVIAVKENKRELEMFKQLKDAKIIMPKWLEFNTDKLEGKVLALPGRDDIDLSIQEHLIVELYSK
ncbi:MAG: 30S ribosomal protein S4 [Clostridia bacterium]|jgi:small subunit ribosomal protein S4|nr:30S ribosomal protein S4 [Clostridia bacterium]